MVNVRFSRTTKSIKGLQLISSDLTKRQMVWINFPIIMDTPTLGYKLSMGLPTLQNPGGDISFSLLCMTSKTGEEPQIAYLGKPPTWEWKRPATDKLLHGLNGWLSGQGIREETVAELVVKVGEQLCDLALVFNSDLLDSMLKEIYFEPLPVSPM